jgi:hypothetical protein
MMFLIELFSKKEIYSKMKSLIGKSGLILIGGLTIGGLTSGGSVSYFNYQKKQKRIKHILNLTEEQHLEKIKSYHKKTDIINTYYNSDRLDLEKLRGSGITCRDIFIMALNFKDHDMVKKLFDGGYINYRHVLTDICESGNEEMFDLYFDVISKAYDYTNGTIDENYPFQDMLDDALYSATYSNSPKIIHSLKSAGASPTSHLYGACKQNNLSLMKSISKEITKSDFNIWMLFSIACSGGNVDVMKEVLSWSKAKTLLDGNNKYFLNDTIESGNVNAVKFLLTKIDCFDT